MARTGCERVDTGDGNLAVPDQQGPQRGHVVIDPLVATLFKKTIDRLRGIRPGQRLLQDLLAEHPGRDPVHHVNHRAAVGLKDFFNFQKSAARRDCEDRGIVAVGLDQAGPADQNARRKAAGQQ